MPSRAVNIALLVLLFTQLATGLGGFLTGEPSGRWVFWAHSVVGFAIVALVPWKVRIARRSVERRGVDGRAALSITFAVLALSALGTGIAWSTVALPAVAVPFAGRMSGLTVHVALALILVPVFVVHTALHWPRPGVRDIASRRAALRWVFVAAAGAIAWQGAEAVSRMAGLSGAGRRFTGSREVESFGANAFPVTNWFTDRTQSIDRATWRVDIGGEVERPALFDFEAIAARSEIAVRATIDCTGGWYSTQDWRGANVGRLLDQAGLRSGARSLVVRSATGFERRFPLDGAERLWLAVEVGGELLAAGHGGPARLIAPGYRGFNWVKWVTGIEVSRAPAWWQPPFPTQ